MALAQDNARPERREIKNATLERSVGNFCGCISIYKASCNRKPPHSAESPRRQSVRPWDWQRQIEEMVVAGVRPAGC